MRILHCLIYSENEAFLQLDSQLPGEKFSTMRQAHCHGNYTSPHAIRFDEADEKCTNCLGPEFHILRPTLEVAKHLL